ncbi:leucine-rich repeat domain-containing protein [Actinophytocola oryzae]|uniref:non-specific serine/threonine protein kinase n=1 Tax=Actinophytocola oryzae TaxID=502181 RepID=A0A4R7VQC7_9PSEU|nr:COR domain-containing protein [Actinophytocola oryzae]TDV51950.1 Leucine-rich repeat (LRR) protein [Actinophytocola oryzae]
MWLESNELTGLPTWFPRLVCLTHLYLDSNKLTEVPAELARMTRLAGISLVDNEILEIPRWFGELNGLTELQLSHIKADLPAELGNLHRLTRLSLGECGLDSAPAWIARLTGLTGLHLHDNAITELPGWLGELTGLTDLKVRGNRLTNLPPSIANLAVLSALDIADNQLTTVPDAVATLTSLVSLDLGGNKVVTLPRHFGGLLGLDHLDLNNCRFAVIPSQLAGLTGLTKLNLGNNLLKEVPPWLGELSELGQLSLNGNFITTLPDELSSLTRLRELNLAFCQLTALPRSVRSLSRLTDLLLDENPLDGLPKFIGGLRTLTKLSLNGCEVVVLPTELATLTGLTTLYLNRNSLTELPEWISRLSNLETLWIDDNPLGELPGALGNLTRLTSLSLEQCLLTELPPWLGSLTSLRRLFLSDNELTVLPDWIAELTRLDMLWLNGNDLTTLPDSLTRLTRLHQLRLENNRLTELPENLGALSRLTTLEASDNDLTGLPDSITGLLELTEVYLDNNELTALPDGMSALTELKTLEANNNRLTALPDWLTELPNLTEISVSANPLVNPPPEIAAAGSESLMAFIRDRKVSSSTQWLSKLLIVGEGGVGKTSLVRALNGEPHDPDEKSTHGLMIKGLPVEHPRLPVDMRLSAWDFGGQQIYHATHQFFLTNRSLFLLLWSSRAGWEQGKLRYWLDIITARAPKSPILLVATHVGDRPVDLPLHELQREYPKIVASLTVDNATREGLGELRMRLAEEAAELPLMGSEWPTSWLDAADAVRRTPENHVTPARMWKIMAEAGVRDGALQRFIATALHELGDILHYSDDPELSETVVLQPGWVNDYISMVLDSDEVADAHGLLTRRHLNELWADLDPGLRDHFLRMMDKYDLSYRIQGGQADDLSLVVERLQWNPPEYEAEWAEIGLRENTREIQVLYRLNTMPPGIPTWFIAREHRFSKRKHWRTGALLGHGDGQHLALVRADTHRNVVELAVRGPMPAAFFSVLDDGLNLTLERFPGLQITRQVPCRCTTGCQELFDYENLSNRMARTPPKDTIECHRSGEDVSVTELLYGLAPSERDATRMSLDQMASALTRIEEQGAYAQRIFLKMQRQLQAQQETRCPSVFAIVSTRKRVTGSAYELRLYCEEPGAWHRLPEPAGCYPITQPAEWLRKLGPYVQHLLKVLKHVGPLFGPVLGVAVDKLDEQVKADVDLMKELVGQLPDEVSHKPELTKADDTDPAPAARAVNDADYRALLANLTKLDPDQRWGGLSRTMTPEGLTLYLCDQHVAGYRPRG